MVAQSFLLVRDEVEVGLRRHQLNVLGELLEPEFMLLKVYHEGLNLLEKNERESQERLVVELTFEVLSALEFVQVEVDVHVVVVLFTQVFFVD